MTVGTVVGGFLLPAIGVMALPFSRAKRAAGRASANTPNTTETHQTAADSELEVLRAIHQVSLVDEQREGTDIARLPVGVYGFSYTPHQESPLFQKRAFGSFEVHKLTDGSVHLVGYTTETEAAQLSSHNECVSLKLYPQPRNESKRLVSIPRSRIVSFKGPSRSDGNFLALDLERGVEEAVSL
jgi:hypothetical protein